MVTNTTQGTEVAGAARAEVSLVETGEQRDRIGRRITPAPRRAELVAAWRESGLTQAAFARREGVIYSSFAAWVQLARRGGAERKGPESRPREPGAAGRPSQRVNFVEAGLSPTLLARSPAAELEVRLVDGTVVRGSRAAELAALVRALRS